MLYSWNEDIIIIMPYKEFRNKIIYQVRGENMNRIWHDRVTDEAFLAETSKYGPSTFLRMCSLLLKELNFVFLFNIFRIYLNLKL